MRGRVTAVVAAAVVVALLGAGAVWAATRGPGDGSSLLVGHYRPTDKITLQNRTVADGVYRVSYGAQVRFFSSVPGAELSCGLVDASGRIGYLDDATFPVAAGGAWTRIGDTATYDVPEITLGIRCSPTVSGSVGIAYRDVTLTAVPVG
jgi:hypothetical protein